MGVIIMVQRRSYRRTPLERLGQVNWRTSNTIPPVTVSHTPQDEVSCVIFVSKRKGFGTTGNQQSSPLSTHGVDFLQKSFSPDKFQRYKVNVYLKETGASSRRKKERGW